MATVTFHYHVAEDPQIDRGAAARSPRSFAPEPAAGVEPVVPSFTSNEAAARYYLDELLRRDDRRALNTVVAEPHRPELVPSLVVENERDQRSLGTHLVRFSQTHRDIPIFGATAVVELTGGRELVSVTADLDEVSGVDPVETLGRREAVDRVRQYTGADLPPDAGVGGRLMFYQANDTHTWHLVWFLPGLAAEPPATDGEGGQESARGRGFGRRPVPPSCNFLVDAHDGEVVFAYSAVPTALATPARCTGIDEDEAKRSFLGRLADTSGTAVVLDDPLRSVRTYDMKLADVDTKPPPPMPKTPVEASSSDFGTTNRAAVSAHLNATRVLDFYKSVLQRNGIDDLGMVLISLVNVASSELGEPPVMVNAYWWDKRMWYGQLPRNGRLVSLSRYLEIIGHELTHGVVQFTSDLATANQPGALNESFADIVGVIINNWYTAPDRNDVRTWNWEIGRGLASDGGPIRDFADPGRIGDPAHMKEFRQLRRGELPNNGNDWGYVHSNSNIHNKAVHNLLMMTSNGSAVFTVEDVAILTYLGMARLAPQATFAAALQAIVDVGRTYFGGAADRDAKIAAIREAYQLVGIA
jgi:Zn-dependent metalloprotease